MVKTLPTVERSTQIRFGKHAQQDQGENTIVLNASNTAVDASTGGAVYVSPVRFRPDYEGKSEIVLMMYNTLTKELTESGESAQDLIGNQGLQAVTNQGNTTSNNLIFYNNVAAFVTTGNVGIANSLASHTLSVGSNVYIDDKGINVLVVSGGVGITDTTTSTSATTGALKVAGGISTEENLNVGAVTKVLSATDASSKTTGALIVTGGVGISKNIHALNANFEDVEADSVNITDTTPSNNQTSGALKVAGGLGVAGNVHCGNLTLTGNLTVTGNTTVINANNLIVQDPIIELGKGNTSGLDTGLVMNNPLTDGNKGNVAMIYDFSTSNLEIGHTLKSATDTVIVMNTANTLPVNINGTLGVTGSTTSSSKTTGAVTIGGGLGVVGDIHATHVNFEDVEADSVTITDNTTSTSATTGALKVVGGISTQENLHIGGVSKVYGTTNATSKTTGALIVSGGLGVAKNIHGKDVFVEDVVSNSVVILDTTTSTTATSGALKVAGGISTQENLNVGAVAKVISATDATSKTTGALIVTGGLGVAKNIHGKNVFVEDVVSNSVVILDTTTSDSATTGALKVVGGISTQENLNVGAVAKVISGTDATSKTTGALIVTGGLGVAKNIHGKNVFVEDIVSNSVVILDTTTSSSATTGALKVVGGISTQENLNVGGATDASSKTTGALIVTGGLGVAKNIHGKNVFVEDVVSNSVVILDTTTSTSVTTGALKVAGGISTQEKLNVGGITKVWDDTAATSKTSGAVQIVGGLGVGGAIFGNTGNFDGSITVAGDLIVSGNTTSQGQNSLTVADPVIEVGIGNVNGADVGMIMNNPLTGGHKGNVAIIYDFSASNLEIGHTLMSSSDSAITMNHANTLAVNINGSLGVTGSTTSSSKTTGAVTIGGGVGISGALFGAAATLDGVVTLTDDTTSTSATTGALKVTGGISTQENLNVGAVAKIISGTDASSKTTGALIVTGGLGVAKNIHGKNVFVEDVVSNSVVILDTTTSTSATTGALKVAGGISTQENLNVGGDLKVDTSILVVNSTTNRVGINKAVPGYTLDVDGDINFTGTFREDGNPFISTPWTIETSPDALSYTAGNVGIGAADPEANLHVTGNAFVSSTTDATTTITGALIVAGGMGIAKKIVGQHASFEDVTATSVTASGMVKGATISGTNVYGTLAGANTAAVTTLTASGMVKGATISGTNVYGTLAGSNAAAITTLNASGVVTLADGTTSTTTTSGALKVAGGVGIVENLNVGGDLKVDTDTLYVDAGNDRVGINKASPAHALDVVGDINFSGSLLNGGATFAGSPWNTETSPDALNYTKGNVGIGAADPAANLHVTGNAHITTALSVGGVVILTDATEATSSTTGALKAAGGVGIAKDVFVGERAYVTGGLVTNTGGVGKKTYSYSADLASGASIANSTYVLDFTNHAFHAKVTAMLIESADEISTMIFDVIGGIIGGASNSAYVPALGQVSVINTSTMSTRWDPAIVTALAGTTVTIKPGTTCTGTVRFNIFVEYLSHETAGRLTSVTNSGSSAGTGDLGY